MTWTACHQLVLVVYRVSATWPAAERYGLIAQARRAAFSSAANIAEGAAKRGHKEFRRFLDISLGSLAELSYVVKLVRDLGMLADQPAAELEAVRDEAGRLTWGQYGRTAALTYIRVVRRLRKSIRMNWPRVMVLVK